MKGARRLDSGQAGMTPEAGQAGMTIVELMIAVVILGVVTAAAFSVAFSIMNSYSEHRRSMGVERSARGAIAVLSEAVRNSSPGVPTGQIIDLIGCETAWTGIHVDNRSDGPDALDVVYASGGIITSTRATFDETMNQIFVEDGSQLVAGDHILVTDLTRGHLVAIDTIVQSGPDWIITLKATPALLCDPPPPPFGDPYLPRTTVLRVQKARFAIETAGGMPVMTMDEDGPTGLPGEPVAEGIEDMQIAVGVDRDGDGTITEIGAAGDDDDWVYNHPADTQLPLIGVTPYRAMRLTLTARTVDETTSSATSIRPPAEDRPVGVAPDEFRRRNLSTVVEIRNLQGSP